MPDPAAGDSLGKKLLGVGCGVALIAAFWVARSRGAIGVTGTSKDDGAALAAMLLVVATVAAVQFVDAKRRPQALLAGSLAAGLVVVRFYIFVPIAFAWLVLKVTRSALSSALKLLILLGVWLLVAFGLWVAPRGVWLPTRALGFYWAPLPAAIIWLVVERGRGLLSDVAAIEEWLYLLAVPRFITPFLQPIAASRFIASRQQAPSARLSLRGLGLSLYGLALCFVPMYTHYALKTSTEPLNFGRHAPLIAANVLRVYAFNAAPIFVSVGLLRVLGFDLGSGFRYPALATSLSDGYRRWNYYFFQYASSVFYFPLVTWLKRHRVPLWLGYILAGYPSYLLGVWALDNVVLQIAVNRSVHSAFNALRDTRELTGYAAIWSLAIGSQVLLSPLRRVRGRWWWRAIAHLVCATLVASLATALFCWGIAVY